MKKLEKLQQIVDTHSYSKIDGVIVDVQTANVILTVYNALGEENKEKYIKSNIKQMADFAWKAVSS